MSGTASKTRRTRLIAAGVTAGAVAIALSPPGGASITAALVLMLLVFLGGWVHGRTDVLSIAGSIATGALGVLLLIPAIALRMSKVSQALIQMDTLPAHNAISRLPQIAAETPIATAPILVGIGAAVIILAGRMGGAVAGAAFGGAVAAEASRTMSAMVHRCMEAEQFEDAVLLSHGLRLLWPLAFVGLFAGIPFVRRGRMSVVAKRIEVLRDLRRDEIDRERERLRNEAHRKAAEAVQAEAEMESATDTSDEEGEGNPAVDGAGKDEEGSSKDPDTIDESTIPVADSDEDMILNTTAEEDGLDLDPSDLEDEPEEKEKEEEEEIVVHVSPEEVEPDREMNPDTKRRQQRVSRLLLVLVTLASGWAASPPWWRVVSAMPSPATGVAVPRTDPGLPTAQRPMHPFQEDFATALQARGHRPLHGPPWPCLPDTYDRSAFGTHPRRTETLAVSATTLVVDLYTPVRTMRHRGVFRMGLTGAADSPFGPLGEFLAWPTVQVLLDRPPRTLQWFKLFPRSMEKLGLLPGAASPSACALAVQEGVTVDQLYSTVRSLSSPFGEPSCQRAVVLVFPEDSSTKNPHPGWRGCP